DELAALVSQLVVESDKVKTEQLAALAKMRGQIKQDFVAGIAAAGLTPSDVEGAEHKAEAAAKAAKVAKAARENTPREVDGE
ncbi:MAG: hypothetical protein KGL72_07060, partial [Actinomycetales bacterium]|nr:hypothetical protein [Actinomycetales bacterium]